LCHLGIISQAALFQFYWNLIMKQLLRSTWCKRWQLSILVSPCTLWYECKKFPDETTTYTPCTVKTTPTSLLRHLVLIMLYNIVNMATRIYVVAVENNLPWSKQPTFLCKGSNICVTICNNCDKHVRQKDSKAPSHYYISTIPMERNATQEHNYAK